MRCPNFFVIVPRSTLPPRSPVAHGATPQDLRRVVFAPSLDRPAALRSASPPRPPPHFQPLLHSLRLSAQSHHAPDRLVCLHERGPPFQLPIIPISALPHQGDPAGGGSRAAIALDTLLDGGLDSREMAVVALKGAVRPGVGGRERSERAGEEGMDTRISIEEKPGNRVETKSIS